LENSGVNIIGEHNNFMGNTAYGVYLDTTSAGNAIWHNSFVNNAVQAYDDGTENVWNSSYPSGGNYWDDWTSPDDYKGPGQNITGSDWIVDDPYVISGGASAQDYYPLKSIPEFPAAVPLLICVIPFVVYRARRRRRG
jgi:hypothetical protein